MFRKQLFDTSRGRIVTLLQRGPSTAEELASKLGLTQSAVRSQLTGMERDGVVQRVGTRRRTTRPARVYELTSEVEQLLSRAYIPLMTHLLSVFTEGLAERQVESYLRRAGKTLARELTGGRRPSGTLRTRVAAASNMLNEHLGALTHVEGDGAIVIRGSGCPLAALTGKHRRVCLAMEALVSEIVGVPARECCDRDARPRCCFEFRAEHARRRP